MKSIQARQRSREALAEMDTTSLRALLAINMDVEGEVDVDWIEQITEELSAREPIEVPDRDKAWESFQNTHLPTGTMTDETMPLSTGRAKPGIKRHLIRTAIVAAVVVFLFTSVTLIAYAANFDIWDSFAQWTSKVFSFAHSESDTVSRSSETDLTNPELKYLFDALTESGIDTSPLPTYLPEGYVQIDLTVSETAKFWTAAYTQNDDCIIISVIRTDLSSVADYEKDSEMPERYIHNDVEYYIMANESALVAIWSDGEMEYCISGASKDELYKMIDSIYLEESE